VEKPQVFDQEGQEQDWDWLVANFGAVSLERAEPAEGGAGVFRIVKLQDTEGPAVQIVTVADQDGSPMGGIRVVRYWPDAPRLPDWPAPTSQWRDRGVYGETNLEGDIGYGMGQGDYYFPPGGGASAVWVADESGPSDFIGGLGMLGATTHRHLDVYYHLQGVDGPPDGPPEEPPDEPQEEPPEEPADGQWQKLFEKLDRIIALLEDRL
jgi:hypothetical protein